ncbi:MAG: ROK family transcriptional regulator [Lachnospiraceae bacterium]|jgi:predicted NBD/HSP70 family sugar kinase|nr:ROK family transcriptional regulator [Lachnospiraceae bacterium]
MTKIGLNNTSLKQQNRGLVLKLVVTGECTSRIELSKKTGLSKMAVSNIVGEFLEDGLIEENETMQKRGKGRNPVQLCIPAKAPKLIGINLYRERCSIVLCNLKLDILQKASFGLNEKNSSKLLTQMYRAIDRILAENREEKIFGIGIGAIGPVNYKQGQILTPPNFYGIHDLNLQEKIEQKYKLPVYFDGESNCAAIAEKYFGSGRACEDFIYVDLANGIGTGVITNGKLYSNSSGMVCELGHTSIDWQGNLCSCGNKGCLETYTSSNVIARQLQEATGEKKSFREFCLEMEELLLKRAKAEDSLSEKAGRMDAVFLDMMEKLACGMISLVNGFNPQKIIIGHEGFWIPDHYLKVLEEKVNERHIARKYRNVQVTKSHFEADAALRGCASSLLTAIFEGQLFYQ